MQPELFPATVTDDDKEVFRHHLRCFGWQTRREICRALGGWTERKVRDVAEALGAEVVRGQAGFKLTSMIARDSEDVSRALQAADAAESQAKKMLSYAVSLRQKLHAIIG